MARKKSNGITTYDRVRKQRFVQNLTLGMEPRAAASAAGFPSPRSAVTFLGKDDETQAMIAQYRAEMLQRYRFDRDKAVVMLIDAYEVARVNDDAAGMVRATHELIAMHGMEAPRQVEASITMQGAKGRRALAELTDEELIEAGGIVLEGEYEEADSAS